MGADPQSRWVASIYKHQRYAYLVGIPDHGNKDIRPGTLATIIKQIDGSWKGP